MIRIRRFAPQLDVFPDRFAEEQRLLRRICENCREILRPAPELLQSLGIDDSPDEVKFYKGTGCNRCHNSGYKGRMALHEVLIVTDPLRDLVIDGVSSTQMKTAAIAEGMVTLRQIGIRKIREGLTSIEEVLAVTMADSLQSVAPIQAKE